ncbi:META domain-containing protein [soil metagenome]
MKMYIFTIFLMAMLYAGDVRVGSAQAGGLTNMRWSLSELNERPTDTSTAFVEFSADRKNASGSGGCNRFFSGVSVDRATMRFSGIGSTRIACPATMETEAEFFGALRAVTRYRITDGTLTLFAGRKAVARFAGVARTDTTVGATGSALEDRKWILESIKGEVIGTTQAQPFINFNGEGNGAGGNTSCNVFGAEYTAARGAFKLSMPISTLRACIEDSSMEVERGMLDGLQQANRFAVFDDRLTLYRDNEVLLVFRGSDK